jgi:hypothetical protein
VEIILSNGIARLLLQAHNLERVEDVLVGVHVECDCVCFLCLSCLVAKVKGLSFHSKSEHKY